MNDENTATTATSTTTTSATSRPEQAAATQGLGPAVVAAVAAV